VKAQSHKRRQEEKLSQIREELREIRNQESNQTRLESQNIEGKIKEIRKDYQKENQMRRDMVVSFEEKQKRNVDRHIKERILSIHGGITETVEEMLARKRKRERELKRLEEVEMGLMEKCSQTNS
jgi:DNA-binding Lrp family transcriptional regulator